DDQNWSAPYFAREFERAGVAAVIIHGRTRAQGFSGGVNLEGIRAVVRAVERIPVIGNGDVRTVADAERMLAVAGCAGVAIGRGALLNPWLFAQLRRWERTGEPGPSGSYEERLAFLHRHFHLLLGQRGERFACLTFRKVANWYCRVLRPGRAVQQRLVRLESVAELEAIVRRLREAGTPPDWPQHGVGTFHIPVPSGPNGRWGVWRTATLPEPQPVPPAAASRPAAAGSHARNGLPHRRSRPQSSCSGRSRHGQPGAGDPPPAAAAAISPRTAAAPWRGRRCRPWTGPGRNR